MLRNKRAIKDSGRKFNIFAAITNSYTCKTVASSATEASSREKEESNNENTRLELKQALDDIIVHHGWLEKQGKRIHQIWHKRYFVLYQNGAVVYYHNENDFRNDNKLGTAVPAREWFADPGTNHNYITIKCKGNVPDKKMRLPDKVLSGFFGDDVDEWIKKGNEGKHIHIDKPGAAVGGDMGSFWDIGKA